MHVLHVIDALAMGGAERMLVEIANRTVADGHRVTVCVTRSETTLAPRLDRAIELVVLGRTRTTSIVPLARLVGWVRRERVDVIHAHGRSSFSLVALLRATRAIRAPIVLHDHKGIEIDASIPRWLPVAARVAGAYAGVYPQHAAWAKRAGFRDDQIHVIPNAIDMAAVAARATGATLAEAAGRARLVFVGGLRDEKSVDVLLDAIARVRAAVHLSIIGGDIDRAYAERCRTRASAPELAGRVAFLGQRDDAMALAASADLAVHSAWSESGPLVLLEYAAVGVPFVSTRVGGIAETLAAANAGRFVPPRDPAALAAAIDTELALSPDERRRRGRAAGELARARFDITAVIPRWHALYAAVSR